MQSYYLGKSLPITVRTVIYKRPLLIQDRPRNSIAEAASPLSMEHVPITLCMTLQDCIAPLSCITVTADTRKGYNLTALARRFLEDQTPLRQPRGRCKGGGQRGA